MGFTLTISLRYITLPIISSRPQGTVKFWSSGVNNIDVPYTVIRHTDFGHAPKPVVKYGNVHTGMAWVCGKPLTFLAVLIFADWLAAVAGLFCRAQLRGAQRRASSSRSCSHGGTQPASSASGSASPERGLECGGGCLHGAAYGLDDPSGASLSAFSSMSEWHVHSHFTQLLVAFSSKQQALSCKGSEHSSREEVAADKRT